MKAARLLLLVSACLTVGACASYVGRPAAAPQPAAIKTSWTVQRDRVYTPAGWPQDLRADIYTPTSGGRSPAVLLIPGGGWKTADRSLMESLAQRLATRGYVVVNATYRLAPQFIFPAPLEDLHEALRFMHRNATSLALDPSRIAVFGYSAGGHLAALLGGISPGEGDAQITGQIAGEEALRVRAVVDGAGPSDLRKFEGGTLAPQFLGGTQAEVPEQFRRASPIVYVSPDDPPVFLYHGGMDMLVSLDHAEDYRAALLAAGVPAELYVLRGRGHVTAFVTDGSAVDAAINFLDRNLR